MMKHERWLKGEKPTAAEERVKAQIEGACGRRLKWRCGLKVNETDGEDGPLVYRRLREWEGLLDGQFEVEVVRQMLLVRVHRRRESKAPREGVGIAVAFDPDRALVYREVPLTRKERRACYAEHKRRAEVLAA